MTDSALDPHRSVVVAASAGTGKTHLLVSRAMRLLLEGADPAGLLAITFTRKAAGEMRERLHQRLQALALATPAQCDTQLRELGLGPAHRVRDRARGLLVRLLHQQPGMRIQTFHAFCLDLLRRFPLQRAAGRDFTLAESSELLQYDAWDALCAAAEHDAQAPLAQALDHLFEHCGSIASTRNQLIAFITHRADWWAFTEDSADPVAHALAAAGTLARAPQPATGWPEPQLRERLARYAALLRRNGPQDQLLADAIESALAEPSPARRLRTLAGVLFVGPRRDNIRKRRHSAALDARLGVRDARALLLLHARLADEIDARRAAVLEHEYARLVRAWTVAGARLLDEFQRLKRQRHVLDFADLEWQAYRLLHTGDNADWIQFKLDERIDHILIDEFQDTNPTQWQLLLPLLQEIAAGGERWRSVFIVGDQKQSIYSFRRAKPELQDVATQWLRQTTGCVRLTLNRSRRAAPALTQAVNRIFAAQDPPFPGFAEQDTHVRGWGRVEVLPLITAAPTPTPASRLRDPLREAPPPSGSSARREEGHQLARRIAQLVATHPSIDDEAGPRPIRYGDIMLLVRSRTHMADYERALAQAGIAYTSNDYGTLLDALEVRDVEALLETLCAPFNDLALAQVLRSPLFAADHAMLEALASCTSADTWFERLPHVAERGDALHRAARLLPAWRAALGSVPTHDLLNRIMHESDALARYRAALEPPLGERAARNLTRLLELALELDSGRYPSAPQFLAQLRALRRARRDAPSEPPPASSERVRLMTVHAAKGLEAPVVILADAAALPPKGDTFEPLIAWPADASRPTYFLPGVAAQGLPRAAAQVREQLLAARREEEHRLLYVALTRARHLLIVSGTAAAGAPENSWYLRVAEPLREPATRSHDESLVYGDALPQAAPAPGGTRDATAPTPTPVAASGQAKPAPAWNPSMASGQPRSGTHPAGAPVPDAPLAHGQAVHRALQLLSEATAQRTAQGLLRQEFPAAPVQLQAWMREALRVIAHPQTRAYFDPACYEHAWNELPVSYLDASGTHVAGTIDRLIRYRDAALVIDYKTHRIEAAEAERAALTFAAQLQAYAAGVRRAWPGLTVRAAVLFTALPLAVEVSAGDDSVAGHVLEDGARG